MGDVLDFLAHVVSSLSHLESSLSSCPSNLRERALARKLVKSFSGALEAKYAACVVACVKKQVRH